MKENKGFSLVEVLISILIIALVSVGSYVAFFVLSQSTQKSRNFLQAVSLGQAALEEVRTVAKNNFDGLGVNVFFADNIDQQKFPDFHRSVNITILSSLYKKADVQITWKDRDGSSREYNISTVISRPPEPLPGNIFGQVTRATNAQAINLATVRATYSGTTFIVETSTNTTGEYNFINAQLKPGNWQLKASRNGYYDSPDIPVNNLKSGENRQVDITLTPAGPANITGRIIDGPSKTPINNMRVYIYENGGKPAEYSSNNFVNNMGSGFRFTLQNFPDENTQRCFTINTQNTYSFTSGIYIGYYGAFCDPMGWGKDKNFMGWSSSIVREDNSTQCNNLWNGAASYDRVCVKSGETVDLGNIALYQVPKIHIQGNVYYSDNTPVQGAKVTVSWPSIFGGGSVVLPSPTTDSSGHYQTMGFPRIPAMQELFPVDPKYELVVKANKTVSVNNCCGQSVPQTLSNSTKSGSLYSNMGTASMPDIKLSLPAFSPTCGGANGNVTDDKNKVGLSQVEVKFGSASVLTDNSGFYQYKCPDNNPYKLNTQKYAVTANKAGYYNFTTSGSWFYSWQPDVSVTEGNITNKDIWLWPWGGGNIQGNVTIAGTEPVVPISAITVKLDYYSDGGNTTFEATNVTDANGMFIFKNVPETWPVPAVVGKSYYNQAKREHRLYVNATEQYYAGELTSITVNATETTYCTIGLPKKGNW